MEGNARVYLKSYIKRLVVVEIVTGKMVYCHLKAIAKVVLHYSRLVEGYLLSLQVENS